MQNGVSSPRSPTFPNSPSHDPSSITSIQEIKEKAQENAQKIARGASAISLIKTARAQILSARTSELSGDLRGALGAYINAGTLVRMFMDSNEYRSEAKGVKGVLSKELNNFMQGDGKDLKARVEMLERKLEELERSAGVGAGSGVRCAYSSGYTFCGLVLTNDGFIRETA